MATPATGEQFLESLVRSGLLPEPLARRHAAAVEDEGPDPQRALANRLIREGLLTPYQGRQLLAGKTRGFFLSEKYKILSLIGTGGMGHVFLCEHLLLQRLVAVKLLQRAAANATSGGAAAALERFIREARAVAVLDHPNIVRVHDMERTGAVPFMVMEYVDGTSLHQIVAGGGALSANRAAAYISQAAAGLQHAHEHGLIHRDIKPGNLLLDRGGTVKLLDLGLARFLVDAGRNNNVTARYNDDQSVVGTADYMSPEQALNSTTLDIRSDIYSLGATLYFLLAGRAPFEGESLPQKLIAHQFRDPASIHSLRHDVPSGLGAVLVRMMAKNRDERYGTPGEVMVALGAWARGTIPPPAPAEMPKLPPAAYKLGLVSSPRDTGRGAAAPGSWEFALAPNGGEYRGDTPRAANDATGFPAPLHERTAPVPTDVRNAVLADPPASPRRLTRRNALLAGGAATALLGAGGLWWRQTTKDGRGTLPPGPARVPPASIEITGSGSTFIKPVMDYWAPLYERHTGVKIKYIGTGSGQGVTNMVEKVQDFGCTDAFLTDAQLDKARAANGEVLHIPLVLGAVVATYNLPEAAKQLNLTGPVLADIYLGKIRKWNHTSIASNNPGVKIPDLDITVIHRAESSGTTFIWTDYLFKVSGEWKAIGKGNTVKWPLGEEAEKNDGVADAVSRKVGAIGYVELSFALQRNLNFARVRNTHDFIEPSLESVTAALNASLRDIKPDLRYTLTDAPGEGSYPIAGTSWAVAYANQKGVKGKELVKFLRWAVHEGQEHLKDLRHTPLPPSLVALIDDKLSAVQVG